MSAGWDCVELNHVWQLGEPCCVVCGKRYFPPGALMFSGDRPDEVRSAARVLDAALNGEKP